MDWIKACKRGNVTHAKLLMEAFATDAEGYLKVPLLGINAAVEHKQIEIVRLFLEMGVNPYEIAYAAIVWGQISVLELLEAAGKFDIGDNKVVELFRRTWLTSAIEFDQPAIVSFLISRGANMNYKSPDSGFTPFLFACRNGSFDSIDSMLAANFDVNYASYLGCTAVHFIAERGFVSVFDALVARGADFNTTTKEGYTPLMLATSMNKPAMVARLLTLGADPNAKKADGQTALDIAKYYGYDLLIDLLNPSPLPK